MTLFYLEMTPYISTPEGNTIKCSVVRYEIETNRNLVDFEKVYTSNGAFLGNTSITIFLRLVPASQEPQPTLMKTRKVKA